MDKVVERRKFIRVPDKLQILYEVISSKKIGEYTTKNVSQGGVRFLVHNFIPQSSYLKIKLALEPCLTCEALVKIAWIRKNPCSEEYEVGVEFISLPRGAQEHFTEYIKTFITAK